MPAWQLPELDALCVKRQFGASDLGLGCRIGIELDVGRQSGPEAGMLWGAAEVTQWCSRRTALPDPEIKREDFTSCQGRWAGLGEAGAQPRVPDPVSRTLGPGGEPGVALPPMSCTRNHNCSVPTSTRTREPGNGAASGARASSRVKGASVDRVDQSGGCKHGHRTAHKVVGGARYARRARALLRVPVNRRACTGPAGRGGVQACAEPQGTLPGDPYCAACRWRAQGHAA